MLQVWQAADATDESGVWKVYQYVREGTSGLRRRVALLSKEMGKGGYIFYAIENEEKDENGKEKIVGATVINETGMEDYIPENILVYIAVDGSQRGKGIGKKIMQEAMNSVNGSIALHVEPDNPAKKLYEKLGFTNKYLEMRWKK